jgi:AcrR family transcriptional regulator
VDVSAESPRLRAVCAEVFADWQDRIRQALEQDGHRRGDAEALAEFILASLEGALILCRARRSTAPLTRTAARLVEVLRAARPRP